MNTQPTRREPGPLPGAETALSLEDGQATWDLIAGRLNDLVERWTNADAPPNLAEMVPAGPLSMRRLLLVELIKLDLEYRHQFKKPRLLEDYVAEFPELSGGRGLPCDLIFEEYRLRRHYGEAVDPDEYVKRFPDQKSGLGRLMQLNLPTDVSLSLKPEGKPNVEVGERLDDFDLQVLLGEGGFAKVFLAWQRSMQRRVALKVSADKGEEAQALARLEHPNIVSVYDQRPLTGRGMRLLYMSYLPGGTLHDVLKVLRATPVPLRSGKLLLDAVDVSLARNAEPVPGDSMQRKRIASMTWPEAVCFLGARIADALDYAHRQGVLHRDIKPANILLAADATPRLADFNVSHCSKLEGAKPGSFFGGSIPYMAPEQIEAFNPDHPREAGSLDGRCDVYSLGVTLWELLTGTRPFPAENIEGDWSGTLAALTLRRRAGIDVATQATLPADLPEGLRDVLLQCMHPDPDQRFASAGDMARQLDMCLKPDTRRLVSAEPGWRMWVRRHPLLALYPLGLVPNALTSWFSIVYNNKEIVKTVSKDAVDEAQRVFEKLVFTVNGSLFPLGMILFFIAFWPVARGLRLSRRGQLSAAEAARLRKHCLRLGPIVALIIVSFWTIAGVIFPLTLHLAVREMDVFFHIHFLVSQTTGGLVATSFPLFLVTALVVRAIYPAFIARDGLTADDEAQLGSLSRALSTYLIIAGSVPMFAVVMLAITESKNYKALGILGAVAIAGFGGAYLLAGQIRSDIRALLNLSGNDSQTGR